MAEVRLDSKSMADAMIKAADEKMTRSTDVVFAVKRLIDALNNRSNNPDEAALLQQYYDDAINLIATIPTEDVNQVAEITASIKKLAAKRGVEV